MLHHGPQWVGSNHRLASKFHTLDGFYRAGSWQNMFLQTNGQLEWVGQTKNLVHPCSNCHLSSSVALTITSVCTRKHQIPLNIFQESICRAKTASIPEIFICCSILPLVDQIVEDGCFGRGLLKAGYHESTLHVQSIITRYSDQWYIWLECL